ncbi:hypothetical protein [Lysobacter enzymogenes]|uniref:hypothetical protein n=1 Tax=Lysobacter enzymogenes TaxID=69 RepID=UPI001A9674AD|nr:hypothetical protein [Lysobacter enzymogenes]QQP94816.1 hypothetical protein JHW38_16385 [Lysobacter enzymogenes]
MNKLGEYMTATPSRRRQIVKDQKNKPAFKAARYKDAREIITTFIASGMIDDEVALDAAEALREDQSGTDFAIQDRFNCADAIEKFVELSGDIDLGSLVPIASPEAASDSLELSGVRVSIRPDALLLDKDSHEVVGCIKLHFAKSQPLDEKGGAYVATAMRAYLETVISSPSVVNPTRCYVVDIATRTIYLAPKAVKRRMDDLSAACEEIKDRWANL